MDLRIEPISVQAQAADTLRRAIAMGHFQPGQRLLEAELCKSLGVSRGSLREALRRLEGEKLVSIVPNRGPVVVELNWAEAVQIYQVRALLESDAAARAATNATPAQRAAMRTSLEAFDAAVVAADAAEQVNATARFYAAMLAGCGNTVIEEVLGGLLSRINLLRRRSMSQADRAPHSARELRAILDAIDAREPEEARATALAHVQAACTAAKRTMA